VFCAPFLSPNAELTDFLPWQSARSAGLTGQKVRSNGWFARREPAGRPDPVGQLRIRAALRRANA